MPEVFDQMLVPVAVDALLFLQECKNVRRLSRERLRFP
jgi:hypothetical protein